MALKSILNNKIRSLLTMLGIIIGVASVIAIVASIQGTTKLQRLQYEAMGANRIDVYAWGAKNKDWKDFAGRGRRMVAAVTVLGLAERRRAVPQQENGLEQLGQRLSSDVFRQRTLRRGNEHVDLCGARPDRGGLQEPRTGMCDRRDAAQVFLRRDEPDRTGAPHRRQELRDCRRLCRQIRRQAQHE